MRKIKLLALVVLTLAVALLTLTSCDVINGFAENILGNFIPEEHVHVFSDATCTEPKTCECGAVEGEALGHNAIEVFGKAPTCTEPGETNFVYCDVCDTNLSEPEEIAPLGHTFVDGKCACGAEDPDYVPPHVHSYESVVTAPACTAEGYTTYTCSCGDSYTADKVEALSHTYTSVVTAPTCTAEGYTTYTCSACGDSYIDNKVAALGHTFIDSKCACGAEYVAPEGEWTLTTTLKNGDLVLIGAPAYGKLLSAEKVSATSYYNKGVNYSADDFSNVTDAEIFVVTVNADGTYTFTSLTGDVIALAASYASLNATGEHKSWALTDRGDGTFLMKNTGRGNYLEWYNSKGNWSTYSAGNTNEYYLSFYVKSVPTGEGHVHNHISSVTAPTCTEAGYTTYTCECGDSYKVDGEAATGHAHVPTVTAPICTEEGYTTHICACGDSYTTDKVAALGHTFVEGSCTVCFAADPDFHVHKYDAVVTAPTCTAAGYTTYTCTCGDTYTGDETEKLGHVDANLDVECDREGCTSKVAPKADSVLSTYTANCLGSKLSVDNKYYVVGTIVEVLDAKNGIFLIDDGTGEKFYFRLPKNAEDVSHANWEIKLVLGDKVQVYGKINKYSSNTAPNGQYWPAMQGPIVTLLEQHPHDFTAIPATCSDPAFCACGQSYGEPLGCADTDGDDLCDDCGRNVKYVYEYVEIRTDNGSGVKDDTAGTYTWGNDNFDVQVAKGTSSQLYSTAKDHMRVYKNNQFILVNKNGITVKTITVYLTNATQVGYFEKFLTGYTYTKDEVNFTITVEINSAETITLTNPTSTTQIKGVEFGYEKPGV